MRFRIKKSRKGSRKHHDGGGEENSSGLSSITSSLLASRSLPKGSCLKPAMSGSRGATAATSNDSNNSNSVRFREVHVREYERTVSDNPSCSNGAPIGIGWKHVDRKSVPLDEFERSRLYYKDSADLVLNRREREEILTEWGVPLDEIIQAIRANVKVKYQRRRTVIDYDKWEEALEAAGRKMKHVLLPKKSKHEQLLWNTTQQHVSSLSLQKATSAQSIKHDDSQESRKVGSVGPEKGSRADFSTAETRASGRVKMPPANETRPTTRRRRLSDGDLPKATNPLLTPAQRKDEQHEKHHTAEGLSPKLILKQLESLSHQMSFDSDTASLSTHPSEAGSHSHRPLVVEFDPVTDDSFANCSSFASEAYEDYSSNYNSSDEEKTPSVYSNWTRLTASSADGNFDGLIRGCPHHLALQPGCYSNDEGPRIQRLQTPVIICEDDGYDDEMITGDFCSVSTSMTPSSYGRPPLPPQSSRAPLPRRAYVITPVAYAQPQLQDPLPSTAYNVVNGRYNDASVESTSSPFAYPEHDQGWDMQQHGFSTLAPPNSSNWNWE